MIRAAVCGLGQRAGLSARPGSFGRYAAAL